MKSLPAILHYSLAGILLGIGFLYPNLWILGLVGVALHIRLITTYDNFQIWGSYLAWTIKFLFVLGFYWTVYPIRWLPLDFGSGELVLVGLYWLTVSLFVGTGGIVFGLLFKLITKIVKSTKWLGYLLIPVIWVVAEIAGSFLLSVFTFGPGALINGYFSLGYIGLLLGEHYFLLLLSKFGGVYFLSLVAVLFSFWLSQFKRDRVKPYKLFLPIGVIAILLVTDFIHTDKPAYFSNTTSVAVISTSFPIEKAFDRENITNLLEEQDKALTAAVSSKANYIILPEDARFFNQSDGGEQSKNYFNFKYPDSEVVIIDSSRVPVGDSAVLQGFVFDSVSDEHYEIHKKYLVPQGEFVPVFYESLFRLVGFGYIIDELESLVSYTIGPNISQTSLQNHHPGVLFCFESSSGVGVRSLMKERPDVPFIAHPVSHTWFNEPESLWAQLETSLQVQAIWNDVAIVSATQHGPSQLFLPNGSVESPRIIESGEHWEVGLFTVPIR